ncbi:MAG TPA: HAD-IIIC family phosphatase [Burkholderiaceae bacterium]|nr:HAD-IIIC family phosphatase [Burkholderiaceae bacterium]
MPLDKFQALRLRLSVPRLTPADLSACAAGLEALARDAQQAGATVRRIAVAGDCNVQLLAQAVACAIAQEGELALVHAVPYDAATQECLDPHSPLHAFRPETVLLVPDWRQALLPLAPDAGAQEVAQATQAQVGRFEALWAALQARPCAIIQHLLVPPPQLLRGVAERRAPAAAVRRVQALNDALLEAGAGRVTWLEADRFASQMGELAWSSARFFHAGKLGFDPRFLPDYLPWFRGAWRAATGQAKKLLVLDLDDTLWGGAIGDEGLDGIALGPGHGSQGEAFAAWQQYVAALGARGVVLAVCSKNAPELAAAGFEHPCSTLRHRDFAAFVCSWDDKATGLRRIAAELCLGLDAMVFVDDNPAERALVQQMLPEVTVVDIGTDPAQFIDRLEAGHWFDMQAYTDADLRRGAAYAGRREAQAAQSGPVDLEAYLHGLQMMGHARAAQPGDLPRLAQMELKTNQFNLTTRRTTQARLAALLQDEHWLLLTLHLRDRFADHGLVASLLALREGEVLRIDNWLMSCRVLGRTAEAFTLAALVRLARQQGATALVGEYLATARNGVVADLYPRLGFVPVDDHGRFWRRALSRPLDDLASSITGDGPERC